MVFSDKVETSSELARVIVVVEELRNAGMFDSINLGKDTVILCKIIRYRGDDVVAFNVNGYSKSLKCYADDRFRLAYKNEHKRAFNKNQSSTIV